MLRIADLGTKKPRKASTPIPSAPVADPVRAIESASSSAALPIPDPGPASTRRPIVLYLLLALLAVGAIVAIVFVATQGDDEKLDPIRAGSTDYTNLGRRIDDPIGSGTGSVATPGTGSGSAPGTSGGSVRRPGTGGGSVRNPSGSGSGTGAGTGSGSAVVETNPATTPLTPDDVVSMSQKMSTGTRRCYDHALKGDPFLKIDKVVATIAVATSGQVSNVSLSKMGATPFGACLEAAIRRWRFRPSSEGIVSDISMIFGKG